ncbi:ABC transporter auxiliary component [Candidatus Magnetomorum sp. HK-1]|nr:ABC transporter auxiliary component [Candidatus Magnetomorum sp. HK-1]
MSDKKQTRLKEALVSTAGIGIMLAVVILANVIISYASFRWDLTEDKMFSLSQGTKNILKNIEEDVTIKVFYNKSLPNIPVNIKQFSKRAIEFLNEYVQHSNGKVTLEAYDPKVDSDEEEWAMKYGLQGMNMPTGEKLFLGVVIMAVDQEESIPFLDPSREALLEYDITRIIYRVQNSKKKRVGVISSLPVFGNPQMPPMPGQPPQGAGTPWLFVDELKKTYKVEEIATSTTSIDNKIDLLVILHPKGLSDGLQYAIDQFVLSGKNAVVFVDPMCNSDQTPSQNQFMRNNSSNLDKLFKSWGIEMEERKVLADMFLPTRVRTQNNKVEANPVWISAKTENFNADNVITANLESLLFPATGAIKKRTNATSEVEGLVTSSRKANLIDSFKANFGAEGIRRDFQAAAEPFNMVVQVQGKFKTAFIGGPPKGEDDKPVAEKDKQIKEAEQSSTIIVIADADMLNDSYYVQKQNFLGFQMTNMFNDNLNLLLNSLEVLSGSDDLIGIRSRGQFQRPFNKVQELERIAQERWHAKEQELVRQLEQTNRRVQELQQKKDPSQKMIISPEQEREIAKFKAEKIKVNKELKRVRRSLRADIENLGIKIKFINIFLMPFFVIIGGIIFAIYRQKKAYN